MVIDLADRHGVADHGLEIDAARLGEAVERIGGDARSILIDNVFGPRAITTVQPQSDQAANDAADDSEAGETGPDDGSAGDNDPAGDGSEAACADEGRRHRGRNVGEPADQGRLGSEEAAEQDAGPLPAGRRIDDFVLPRARVRRAPYGRRGPAAIGGTRGRPGRVVPFGRRDAPLALLPTIRAALPWQVIRASGAPGPSTRVIIKPEDLRGQLRRRRTGRLTILLVDASGSMAQDAVRTAKSMAIGLLDLAYQRRDQVAIVLARGQRAVLGLEPTRSRAKAMQCLRRLPTGGGTPLASALLLAANLATRYDPGAVELVIFTDGRANVGVGGDPKEDAVQAVDLVTLRFGSVRLIEPIRPVQAKPGGIDWLSGALAGAGRRSGV